MQFCKGDGFSTFWPRKVVGVIEYARKPDALFAGSYTPLAALVTELEACPALVPCRLGLGDPRRAASLSVLKMGSGSLSRMICR